MRSTAQIICLTNPEEKFPHSSVQVVTTQRSPVIAMKLDDKHLSSLQVLAEEDKSLSIHHHTATVTQLEQAYQSLSNISKNKNRWNKLKLEEKMAIEHYKLSIIKAVEKNIREKLHIEAEIQKQVQQNKIAWWRYLLFGFLVTMTIVPAGFGIYLGLNELLALIPGMSEIGVQVTSAFAALIECLMFYSIMKPFMQNALNIHPEQSLQELTQGYNDRLDTMERLN